MDAIGASAWEIVVVDDGSTDDTAALVEARSIELDGVVRLIRHDDRYGQSAALCTGVWHARYRWIATLDGDGQNDPHDIYRMWELAESAQPGRHVAVVGHRAARRDRWQRRAASYVLNRISAYVLRHPLFDNGCGTKLFPRDVYMVLPRFDHMHRYLPALLSFAGVEVLSVPVNHRPRAVGRSHYRTWARLAEAMVDVCGLVWLKRRMLRTDVQPPAAAR